MAAPRETDATFAQMVQQHRAAALQLLRRLAPADAEDLVQEALAKAWRYRASFVPGASSDGGRAWLMRAAFRAFLDHRRRVGAPAAVDPSELAQRAAPGRCPAADRDELARALLPLRPLERALLLGFHGERCSLDELARRHGLPRNTVKSHLHRARRRLAAPEDPEARDE
ncbi:MAG: RNA polymerase sigma factor [Planctomycetota bacterium]